MFIMKESSHISRSPEDTRKVARKLIKSLPPAAGAIIIALHGEMGSGKTCFVQGIALTLGIKAPVTSPTFTLINEYKEKRPLYHIDLYRLNNTEEALALGLEEYMDTNGIIAIEWAERAEDLFPPSTIHIYFKTMTSPEERTIIIKIPETHNGHHHCGMI